MGLDVSHQCWNGPYRAFHRWRCALAEAAGFPPLEWMDGFQLSAPIGYVPQHTIKWDVVQDCALTRLLQHSDCDGKIPWRECYLLAQELENLLPKLDTVAIDQRAPTLQFIRGLRYAAANEENVEFS